MQRSTLVIALGLSNCLFLAPIPALALPEPPTLLQEIVVTASRIPTAETQTTFATEVHTRRMIENAGSTSLFDYLSQHTAIQVQPSSGNRMAPLLDLRGFGLESGYQNIAVTLDGRRLNTIDLSAPTLGSIPIGEIERIEITRGSGSVLLGDGATAGAIQIVTRPREGIEITGMSGDDGALAGSIAAGKVGEGTRISARADYDHQEGHSATDPTGHRDHSLSRIWRGSLETTPLERLKLKLEAGSSRIDTRYVNYLTPAQFEADPAQLGTNPWTFANSYNRQLLSSDQWQAGAELQLTDGWKAALLHGRENKRSDFIAWASDYDHTSDDLSLQYRGMDWDLTLGAQRFDGQRIAATNRISKTNSGAYAQAQRRAEDWSLSLGLRREQVDYAYTPNAGAATRGRHGLTAWDLGANYRLNQRTSLYGNLNQAFQAPDVDRFFTFGGGFNGLIKPARAQTLNLGLHHHAGNHRLQLTLFRIRMRDEIYYEPVNGSNTNLDRSSKTGIEFQDRIRLGEQFSASLHYTLTRARITREADNGGAYNGKELPGTPGQTAMLGLTWRPDPRSSLNLSHAWRSSGYAVSDFDNNGLRQSAYQSTSLIYHRRFGDIDAYAAVDNLFEHKNSMAVDDQFVGPILYPVQFTRVLRIGVKAWF